MPLTINIITTVYPARGHVSYDVLTLAFKNIAR